MRRHAKASTAGSTKRQATGLGRFLRGADATRGSSRDSKGSGAPAAGRLVLPVGALAGLLCLLAAAIPAGALAATPVVTTTAATGNTGVHATLNGTVNPEGEELSECKFEWGKVEAFDKIAACAESNATIGNGTSPVAVHADISGLQPNGVEYRLRLVAKNPTSSVVKGSNQSFTTPNTVVTTAASGTTPTATTLNGTVNPDGVAMTECLFEWGETTSYGNTAPCVPNAAGIGSGTSAVPVSAALSGLEVGTIYHYRLKAANANGPILGTDKSVLTAGPMIAAAWSQDVVYTEATLKAEINPEGSATTYHFEYGTSEAYGQETPELPVGSDSTTHTLTRFLEGLSPGTTYHYRVVATSSVATNEGPDHTFTTFEPFAPDTNCANQAFRGGASAGLPDCRAYEMVTPGRKRRHRHPAAGTKPSAIRWAPIRLPSTATRWPSPRRGPSEMPPATSSPASTSPAVARAVGPPTRSTRRIDNNTKFSPKSAPFPAGTRPSAKTSRPASSTTTPSRRLPKMRCPGDTTTTTCGTAKAIATRP